jgi:hypothetical protein
MICLAKMRVFVLIFLGVMITAGCRGQASPPSEQAPKKGAATGPAAGTEHFSDSDVVVLVDSAHDTLGAARLALEAALRLPVDLPLPYPRVERHGDLFRVVLARGAFSALRALRQALAAAGHPVQVLAAGQAGNDDVLRLGIVCTDGDTVPLYAAPLSSPLKEVARLKHGQVVALKEEDDDPHPGDSDGDEEGSSEEAEKGFLPVLQPQVGLVRGPDVLLPADCTPRDEDNDDGNGRILGADGASGFGRLCLTTRFSGRVGNLQRADVVVVTPSYRHCLRFPSAGTFDGFDHSHNGTHFAIEVEGGALRLYAVPAAGVVKARGQWPGLSRPAFLGDDLVALSEEPSALSISVIEGLGRRDASDTSPLPTPKRIAHFGASQLPPLPDKVPIHRPGAPTLSNGRMHTSFLRGCRPEWEKRVRAAAHGSYVQCLLELEAEVGLHGEHLDWHCHLDNAENPLEEALTIQCPASE